LWVNERVKRGTSNLAIRERQRSDKQVASRINFVEVRLDLNIIVVQSQSSDVRFQNFAYILPYPHRLDASILRLMTS